MTTSNQRVFIDVTGWFDLSADEVWPDGDAPDTITAEAVRDVMQACGGKVSTLTDWELLDGLEVHVSVGTGDQVEVWKTGWRNGATS